ncbi:Atypical chemokine receptor 3 [Trichoplax sp. H2]|nr:Atypical chemokine receptor 3 [Trichoplax sp. H2]|eukprot:RDD36784.1 Atypical chemokine receptor 3 [Trichoplax sp. H2]
MLNESRALSLPYPSIRVGMDNETISKIAFYHETSRYLAVFMIPIYIFGIGSNILSINTIYKCRRFHTPSYILSVNMATSDIMLLSNAILFGITNSIWLFSQESGTTFRYQKILCKINLFMLSASYTTSSQSLMAISIDRYFTIVHLKSRSPFTSRRFLIITIILTWVIGFTVASPFIVITNNNEKIPFMCDLIYDDRPFMQIYLLVTVVIGYPIPLVVVATLYYKIIRRVKSSIMANKNSVTVIHHSSHRQINATKIMFIATFLFMSNSIPFAIVWVTIAVIGKSYVEFLLSLSRLMFILISFAFGLGIMNALQNPIISLVFNQTFRRAVVENLRKDFSLCSAR